MADQWRGPGAVVVNWPGAGGSCGVGDYLMYRSIPSAVCLYGDNHFLPVSPTMS